MALRTKAHQPPPRPTSCWISIKSASKSIRQPCRPSEWCRNDPLDGRRNTGTFHSERVLSVFVNSDWPWICIFPSPISPTTHSRLLRLPRTNPLRVLFLHHVNILITDTPPALLPSKPTLYNSLLILHPFHIRVLFISPHFHAIHGDIKVTGPLLNKSSIRLCAALYIYTLLLFKKKSRVHKLTNGSDAFHWFIVQVCLVSDKCHRVCLGLAFNNFIPLHFWWPWPIYTSSCSYSLFVHLFFLLRRLYMACTSYVYNNWLRL